MTCDTYRVRTELVTTRIRGVAWRRSDGPESNSYMFADLWLRPNVTIRLFLLVVCEIMASGPDACAESSDSHPVSSSMQRSVPHLGFILLALRIATANKPVHASHLVDVGHHPRTGYSTPCPSARAASRSFPRIGTPAHLRLLGERMPDSLLRPLWVGSLDASRAQSDGLHARWTASCTPSTGCATNQATPIFRGESMHTRLSNARIAHGVFRPLTAPLHAPGISQPTTRPPSYSAAHAQQRTLNAQHPED